MLTDCLDKIFRLIADELDITQQQILSDSREAEVVDARYVAIMLLRHSGRYPNCIARILTRTPRAVNYALTTFDDRLSANKPLARSYSRILTRFNNSEDIGK